MIRHWLIIFLQVYTVLTIPDCEDEDIVFTVGPQDVNATCNTAETATFQCQYEGTTVSPKWVINSSVYSSLNSHLPADHTYDNINKSLTVVNIYSKNNSIYQCQLVHREDNDEICAYRSSIGRLIITDPDCKAAAIYASSLPYYHYNNFTLDRVLTTIHQSQVSNAYSITYSNLHTGDICGRATSSDIQCDNTTCSYIFNILTSTCVQNSDLNVSVSASTPNPLVMPKEEKIDGTNRFVKVLFKSDRSAAEIQVKCDFINQAMESLKFCAIAYGSDESHRENSESLIRANSSVFNTNSISIGIDLQLLKNSTAIYVMITAGNSTKVINMEASVPSDLYEADPKAHGSEAMPPQVAMFVALLIGVLSMFLLINI